MGESGEVKQGEGTQDLFVCREANADVLRAVRGFMVRWDDGSSGVAGDMAIFVRTAGLGTGHQKLELVTADAIVAILPEERTIVARASVAPAGGIGTSFTQVVARGLRRILGRPGPT